MILFPKTPPNPRYTQQLIFLIISVVVFIPSFFYLIGWGLTVSPALHRQAQARAKDYESAPGCGYTSHVSSSVPPCTYVRERIVGIGGFNQPSHQLTLQAGNGTPHNVRLANKGLWQAAIIGDDVTVKYWKGDAVGVSGDGHETITLDNPDLPESDDNAMTAFVLVLVSSIFIAIFSLLIRAR